MDCPTTDHSAMVTCLRKKEAQDILKALKSTRFEIVDPTQWGPVVDTILSAVFPGAVVRC